MEGKTSQGRRDLNGRMGGKSGGGENCLKETCSKTGESGETGSKAQPVFNS